MKRVINLRAATMVLSMVLPIQLSIADTLVIPVASQGQHNKDIAKPGKSQSQQQVIDQFGQPEKTTGPVGDPPIDRWDYKHFSVYFEHNHVIHSVLKHQPPENQSDENTSTPE